MGIPRLVGQVERRLLINYRAAPEVVARLLPPRLRAQVIGDWAVVGICMIRLGAMRPAGLPRALGFESENAAHRIAVEWDGPSGVERGVYIPRRDTSSAINVVVGGRVFPGVHHRADFDVDETAESFRVGFRARDGSAQVSVVACVADELGGRLFRDVDDASAFFRAGSIGLSPARAGEGLETLELRTDRWEVEPLSVMGVRSSFFDGPERFPDGSIEFDCGLLMRDIPVVWSSPSIDNVAEMSYT